MTNKPTQLYLQFHAGTDISAVVESFFSSAPSLWTYRKNTFTLEVTPSRIADSLGYVLNYTGDRYDLDKFNRILLELTDVSPTSEEYFYKLADLVMNGAVWGDADQDAFIKLSRLYDMFVYAAHHVRHGGRNHVF